MCQAQDACMMLWLKTFCEIRWTVTPRSDEVKTGFWRIYCHKRGKLGGLGYSYPPKPSPIKWRDALNPPTDFQALMIYYTKRYFRGYLTGPASLRGVGSTLSPSCRLYEPEAGGNSPGEVQCSQEGHWPWAEVLILSPT